MMHFQDLISCLFRYGHFVFWWMSSVMYDECIDTTCSLCFFCMYLWLDNKTWRNGGCRICVIHQCNDVYSWLFQLDDSKSVCRKLLFHQTSILSWLFWVPAPYSLRWLFVFFLPSQNIIYWPFVLIVCCFFSKYLSKIHIISIMMIIIEKYTVLISFCPRCFFCVFLLFIRVFCQA